MKNVRPLLGALALFLAVPAHANLKTFCERWFVTAAATGDDARARTLVIALRDKWRLTDDALELTGSIVRTIHGLDRMLGRPPQGATDVEERAKFSLELLRSEWADLHQLDAATIAQCLGLVDRLEREPALAERLAAAFAHAHLSQDEYLNLPFNRARVNGPWAAL